MIWRLIYCNKEGVEARLDIIKGASTPVEVIEGTATPFVLNYKMDKGDKSGHVMSSSADISIFETPTFNIDNLKTSSETEIKVEYYINSVLSWVGFVIPDFFSRQIGSPAVVEMTASDRLSTLKSVTLTGLTTRVSLRSLLVQSLAKTELSLPLTATATFTHGATNVLDTEALSQRLVDNKGRSISCYDIIQSILIVTNATLLQTDGEWVLKNKIEHEAEAASVTFDDVDAGARRTIVPVASSVGVFHEHGGGRVYPENNNFSNGTSGWTAVNGFVAAVDNKKIDYYLFGSPFYSTTETVPNYLINNNERVTPANDLDTAPYIESDLIPIVTTEADRVKLNVDISVTAPGGGSHLTDPVAYPSFVRYAVLVTDGTEVLALNRSGALVTYDKTKSSEQTLLTHVKNTIDRASIAEDVSKAISAELVLGDDILSYSVKIRIYGSGTYQTVLINHAHVSFTNTVSELPKGSMYKTRQGANYTKVHDPDTIIFGDYLTGGLNGYFYDYPIDDTSSMYLPSGELSRSWTAYGDSEELPLLQHVVRQRSRLFSVAHDILRATIDVSSFNPMAIYQDCAGNKYVIVSARFDFLRSTVDAELEQVAYGSLGKKDYIYSYFGESEEGISSVGGISGGGTGTGGGGMTAEQIELLNTVAGYWTLDENGNLKTTYNAYSEQELSAYGIGSGGSSGGGVNLLQAWTDYDSTKDNWAVKAGLLVPFYNDMQSRVGAIEAGGGGGGSNVTWGTESGGYIPLTVEGVSKSVALSTHNHSGVYEPAFTKNTAFNKDFGTTSGTVAQGNDSRIVNGATAYGWGNHASAGYALNSALTAHINKVDNPHSVTKAQVGLGNVLNVASYSKTESDAALALKLNKSIFDDLFEKVEVSTGVYAIKAKYSFYSIGEVSAYGIGDEGSGGGTSYDRLDAWVDYDSTKAGWVLSALLGVDLNTRVGNLEGGSALTVNTTGTGNAITSIDKAGTVITATKGATFSLDNHLHAGVYEPVFSKNTAFNKNFGTTAGTVAEGNHTHDDRYKRWYQDLGIDVDANRKENTYLSAYRWINTPVVGIGILETNNQYSNDWVTQEFTQIGQQSRKFIRSFYGGTTWGDWFEFWHSGNLTNLNQLTTRNFSDLQNKPTTLAEYGITDFTSHENTNPIDSDNTAVNAIGYTNSVSLFGQNDGGLINIAYSTAWQSQIFQDFRTGQIALRGKNNGTWTGWRTALDSENYNSYSPTKTGTGAGGTWGINVTGNASSATKLQTARTIWGQSFDGTGNVSGAITGATTGVFSSTVQATTAILTNLTANYLPKHTANGLVNSLIYDNGTNVGIGTTLPNSKLSFGTYYISSATPTAEQTTSTIRLYDTTSIHYGFGVSENALNIAAHQSTGTIRFHTNFAERAVINNLGYLGIGTTSPSYKLDVNGTGRFTGALTAAISVTTPKVIFAAAGWSMEQTGTELLLKYNNLIAARFLSDGSIVGLGEITAYGATTGGEGVSLLRTGGTMTGNLTMSADIIMNNGRAIGISNLPLKLLGNALTYNASNVLTEANTATQIKMGNGWTIEQTTSALTIKKNGVVKGTFNA